MTMKHNTMSMKERGRLGGMTTSERYGREYMARIGRKGFKALCCRFYANSRRRALMHLNGKGTLAARWVGKPDPRDDATAAELYAAFDLD
jgi:general stress protein YciG